MKVAESPIHKEGRNGASISLFIPRSISLALDLKAGDFLEWHVEDNKVFIRKKEAGA